MYHSVLGSTKYKFRDLKELLAKATPLRSGDQLAGVAACSLKENTAAKMALADLPLQAFKDSPLLDPAEDDVSKIIVENLDEAGFAALASFTIGDFRDWLLKEETTSAILKSVAKALLPEMVAAVSKIMSNKDLILVASKCINISRFRNTLGLKGHFATRLQPNHPTDDLKGIAASILEGLMYGIGDAVIGVNPASDNPATIFNMLTGLDQIRLRLGIPTQTCVLTHLSTTLELANQNVPVDLLFQSIGGTQATNESFGISIGMLREALDAGRSLARGTVGDQCLYFETGQGSALSANANHGIDQQTCEARAYGLARLFDPLLVNSVVGFIGPEYLYDGKQIIRAGLEDHFCGKLLGLPMGVDICYTNHAVADQDDMDTLLTLLGAAGCNFVMGVPGADDIMLNYQSTSFHDALYVRELFGFSPAPEFKDWLLSNNLIDSNNRLTGYLHKLIPEQILNNV